MSGGGRGRGRARGRAKGIADKSFEIPKPGRRPDCRLEGEEEAPQSHDVQPQQQEQIQQQQRQGPLEERPAQGTSFGRGISSKRAAIEAGLAQNEREQKPPASQGATALDETTESLSQMTMSSSVVNINWRQQEQIQQQQQRQGPLEERPPQGASFGRGISSKRAAIEPGLAQNEREQKPPASQGYTKREEKIQFPRRPGYGKAGQPINLIANFFGLTLPANDIIYHYDVTIEPQAVKSVHREIITLLYNKFGGEAFGKARPAYDGSKNLYTMKDLPVGKDGAKFNVAVPSLDGKKDKPFTVKIKFAAKVDLKELKKFLVGQGAAICPQNAIMLLNIALRHMPSFEFEAIGKLGSFFPQNSKGIPLGDGIELRFGFSQSVRHSEWNTVLVNVDVSAKAFYKQQPLVNYISEVLNIGPQDLDNPNLLKNRRKQYQLKDAILGLRVHTNHLDNLKRKFIIGRIVQPANQSSFECEGTKVTVEQYMKEKYNINLRYPNLPCVQKQGSSTATFPLEVLDVVPCVKKKITNDQTAKMLRQTARPAQERQKDITEWAKQLQGINQEYLKDEFGIEMKSDMVDVEGRVLPTPVLGFGGRGDSQLTPKDGAWDMRGKQFYSCAYIECWAIVLFLPEFHCNAEVVRRFSSLFKKIACREGLIITSTPDAVKYERPDKVEDVLCSMKSQHQKLQLFFCVLPDTGKKLYGEIKRVGDNVIGVVTQCVQLKLVQQATPEVCSNLAMKVNVKLGGINHIISKDVQAPIFKEPVIVFGADVTHPAVGDMVSPSIAAVVASVDLLASSYTAIVRAQVSKNNKPSKKTQTTEIIDNLDKIVKELLIRYYRHTKYKPAKILFYRDGVGEGQFEQVYMYELQAIQKACMSLPGKYRPKITLVVVQKRHHTRLFCADRKDQVGKSGNIPAGTTVDRGIVHPYEFDFYLCSHYGTRGTSRPSHYHVLHDDNRFTADHLQQVTNELCYTFARCTRSVSIPSPVYYAHLAAFRARYHVHPEKFYDGGKQKSHEEIQRIVNSDIKVEERHSQTMYFT